MTILYFLLSVILLICLLILFLIIGQIRARNIEKSNPRYKVLSPEEVLWDDLSWALSNVGAELRNSRRGDSFPTKIQLAYLTNSLAGGPSLTSNSWTKSSDVIKIVAAILEQRGWIVYQDTTCGAGEIVVDVPRAKLQNPE
jgi:hypothetical protein